MKKLIKSLKQINATGAKSIITPDLINDLAKYKPNFPITVFRGLAFVDEEDFYKQPGINRAPKIGDKFLVRLGQHWTTSYSIAEEFSYFPGKALGLIVKADIEPNQIIVEMDRLPQSILEEIEWNNEEEVILHDNEVEVTIIDCWVT